MPENLLAIDNGTQTVRALLFDPRGNLLAKERVPIEPYYSTAPGLAEQDPAVFWNALCAACQGLFKQKGVDASSIAAVSLTTQRSTVINLDADGKPLRPAIVWLDQRRTEGLPPVERAVGRGLCTWPAPARRWPTCRPKPRPTGSRTHQPEIWKATHKYLFLSGYLTHLLTGRFVDSVGCQVGYMPFDYKTQRWAASCDWKWQAVPIDPALLPTWCRQGQAAGRDHPRGRRGHRHPRRAAAHRRRRRQGLRGDRLRLRSTRTSACLSYGTTATINTTHDKYIEVIPLIPPYPAAVPGALQPRDPDLPRLLDGELVQAGIRPARGTPGRGKRRGARSAVRRAGEIRPARLAGAGAAALLVARACAAPAPKRAAPSSALAMCTPAPTSTAPSWKGWPTPCAKAPSAPRNAAACRSPSCAWPAAAARAGAAMQLTADIFGLPTARPHVYEATGLGAAIDAAVGAKLHPDFKTAVEDMTHTGDIFEPNSQNHRVYDQLYNEIYLKMYKQLQPFYKKIRQIG